jgi:DNA-binding response OmpR family regulator
MRVLVAEDDLISNRLLTATLVHWGYEVVTTRDGAEAWEVLRRPDSPPLCILDGMMPEMDGLDLCRQAREARGGEPLYLILLSARGSKESVVEGLKAGADDYIIKPFESEELRARLEVGLRVLRLQHTLIQRVTELEAVCCPFACIARKFATTRITGNDWKPTSVATRRPSSATVSVRSATSACCRPGHLPKSVRRDLERLGS